MKNINYVIQNVSNEDTSEYMAETLMDDKISTYGMFESLVAEYENGSEEFKEGLNIAVSILTGYYLQELAEQIKDRYSE